MATTRSYRLNRIALELELAESARRAAWNAAELEAAYRERVAAGVAPMEPAELVALFQRDAAAAWGALAAMTREQRINQAIETACWLEGQDRPISWGAILDKWESHLAENTGEKAAGSHAGAREDAIVCAVPPAPQRPAQRLLGPRAPPAAATAARAWTATLSGRAAKMAAELLLHNATQAALVDAEDLAELGRWRWFELGGYVVRQQRTATGSTLVYLHRQLLRASRVEVVDHINNNRLDNRRANLRLCSQSENLANRPAPMPHGYRGVYPEQRGGNWRAQIKVQGKNRRLGTYPTPEAAARAYDVAALAAWGRFARLNFPGETPEQLALDLEGDPFDVPAPATRLDWYELAQLRRWRESQAPALGAYEGVIDNCGIPF